MKHKQISNVVRGIDELQALNRRQAEVLIALAGDLIEYNQLIAQAISGLQAPELTNIVENEA